MKMNCRLPVWRGFVPAVMCFAVAATSAPYLAADDAPAAKPAADVVEISVTPATLELSSIRDARRVIVTGKLSDGTSTDLSGEAKLAPAGPQVSVDEEGFIHPAAVGETTVTVSAAGKEAGVKVVVKDVSPRPVSFVREIEPVLSKVGCNAGTCHGAQQGKAGFKLALRGYDPLYDYRALVDDVSARRFNRSMPSQSLMLLKPTQGVPHEGGFLFDENSIPYKLIQQWIAEGCKYDGATRVVRIAITPEKPLLEKSGQRQQLIVTATFDDGSTRDVTRDSVYETSNFEVATVDKSGIVKSVRRGEAAALVRYEGLYAAAPVTVVGDREGYQWVDSPEFGEIDTLVNNKLKRMKILPSELCTDADFIRRVSLDLTGLPPTIDATRAFLADTRDSRTKRAAKIEELLESPEFVDHWTLKWSDLLLANRKFIQEKGVWAFRNWIRRAIATNMPYDQFARELMTASGSTFENPAANYFRIAPEADEVMSNMTQVFLGTRFQCNKCHDHPFERWTQGDYYNLAAYFAAVGRKPGTVPGEEIIYTLSTPQPVVHPGTGQPVAARFPFEHKGIDAKAADLRQQLSAWLTSTENPYFAKSLVNRYWSYFTGLGIIDPVDDIRASNPASNPELLDWLTKDFVAHHFDMKHLIRTIVSSHTYQRSFLTNDWNRDDRLNFSHALPRRLTAEQLYDAIRIATATPSDILGVPAGFRASQLPDPEVEVSFLDMFGRPARESPCECERSRDVSLAQTLSLINGPTVSDALIHPNGLVARKMAENASPRAIVEEVYLSVLCRVPTEEEFASADAYIAQVGNVQEAAQDLMWALINSPAFLFNR